MGPLPHLAVSIRFFSFFLISSQDLPTSGLPCLMLHFCRISASVSYSRFLRTARFSLLGLSRGASFRFPPLFPVAFLGPISSVLSTSHTELFGLPLPPGLPVTHCYRHPGSCCLLRSLAWSVVREMFRSRVSRFRSSKTLYLLRLPVSFAAVGAWSRLPGFRGLRQPPHAASVLRAVIVSSFGFG